MNTCLRFPGNGVSHCCLKLQSVAGERHWPCYLFRTASAGGACFCVNMHCLALSRGFRFLTHVAETLIFAYFAAISLADSQGLFPRLENVGAFKNVSLVPTEATCGLPDRSTFCHSPAAAAGLEFCTQRLCIQDCPYRSSAPVYTALFSAGLGSCISVDKHDLCPICQSNSTSFIFGNRKNCSSSPPSPRLAASFTLAVWLKPEREGVM